MGSPGIEYTSSFYDKYVLNLPSMASANAKCALNLRGVPLGLEFEYSGTIRIQLKTRRSRLDFTIWLDVPMNVLLDDPHDYLLEKLWGFNLDPYLCSFLAWKISSFAVDLAESETKTGFNGFYAVAEIEVEGDQELCDGSEKLNS